MVPIVEALASGQIELPSPPFLLKLDVQDTANGLWPCIYSETGVLRRLLALSPCWDISYVISRQVSFAWMTRLVTEFKPLQYQNALLLAKEAKERAAALRTLRKTMRALVLLEALPAALGPSLGGEAEAVRPVRRNVLNGPHRGHLRRVARVWTLRLNSIGTASCSH